jgi:hypothetical protein
MDSYLAKPVSKDALLATVARSLEQGTGTRTSATTAPGTVTADAA